MGVYLRTTQRKNKNGTTVRYVQLAHNRRVNGTMQVEGVHNVGHEDHLDTDGLRRLVASINRYLGEDRATELVGVMSRLTRGGCRGTPVP